MTSLSPRSQAELRTVRWRSDDSWQVVTAPSPMTCAWTPLSPTGHWYHHLLTSSILRWSGVWFLWAFHPHPSRCALERLQDLCWGCSECRSLQSTGLVAAGTQLSCSSLHSAPLPCSTLITDTQGHPNVSPDNSVLSEQEIFVKLLDTIIIYKYRTCLQKVFFLWLFSKIYGVFIY